MCFYKYCAPKELGARKVLAAIKKLFAEARPYAEGRGIRFPVTSTSDIPMIKMLVEIKLAPK